jgi:hypothetical protein
MRIAGVEHGDFLWLRGIGTHHCQQQRYHYQELFHVFCA